MAILSKTTKPATPQTLHGCRERVADLKAELAEVRRAGLPDAEVEESLHRVLDQSERQFRRVIESAGEAIAGGRYATLAVLLDHQAKPETLALIALGGCIANMGQHKFVSLAREHAKNVEGPALRMPSRERRERIEQLTREIFELEATEELLREKDGAERRHDADALAVLGLPFEIVRDHGLIRGEQ